MGLIYGAVAAIILGIGGLIFRKPLGKIIRGKQD